MATHNQVRVIGYLITEPIIMNEGNLGAEKIRYHIRTVHRKIDGLRDDKFQDIMIFYDGTDFMEKMKKLKKYDVVDIKGVFNVLTINKKSECPYCGEKNIKPYGSLAAVYPISFIKINAWETCYEHDVELPERILTKYFQETSNYATIIGTVANTPELLGTEEYPCCRYMLAINRKYYIKTQDNITADYPYIYSYGKQARNDYRYLKQGSVVMADCFVRMRKIKNNIRCNKCDREYQFLDVASELVPYSVEYLQNFLTEEEAMELENEKLQADKDEAENKIFDF